MTIPSYDNRRSYSGDGTTTVFAFPPPFTANTDLTVQIQAADGTITTKVLGTDYTVTGAGNPAGGSVTMTAAPVLTTTLIIYRDVPLTQSVDLQDGGPLPAGTINKALDRITMWGQRLKEQISALGTLATQTAAGLMSAADKLKLDGIQAGAQVNAVTSVAGKTGAVTLVKGDVGLGNVDNTSDASKPISTATQTALNAKANTSALAAVAFSGAKADVGLGNVDNTSDLNKPVSTAQQTALNAKLTAASNLSDLANAATARTNLGLVIGTDVQAYDSDLAAIAAIAPSRGDVLFYNGTAWARLAAGTNGWFLRTNGSGADPSWVSIPGGGDMLAANNLSDVANVATARTNLGGTAVGVSVFTAASQAAARTAIGAGTGSGDLLAANNLSDVASAATARTNLGGTATGVAVFTAASAAAARTAIGAGTGNGNGSVTSIGISMPTQFSVANSPVTTSGTLTITWGTGSIPVENGGTGQTSYTVGDILYADTNSTLAKLADVAGGNVLRSGGVGAAPSWGKVGLTTHVTGTLPVANGGTNITTFATGDILYASAANTLGKLAIGSAGQVLTVSGGAPAWGAPAGMRSPDIWVREEQVSGTNGGGFTSGADQTRVLNTIKNNAISASLGSNQLTLPAGTYVLQWRAPAAAVSNHQSLLYNVTDSAVIERGSSEYTSSTNGVSTSSFGLAILTIAASKALEVRHRCNTTKSTDGLGRAASFGTEIYSEVWGWKVA